MSTAKGPAAVARCVGKLLGPTQGMERPYRGRLLGGCAALALLIAPASLTLGIALPASAQTVIPSGSSPVDLSAAGYNGATDFLVPSGNTINSSGALGLFSSASPQPLFTIVNRGSISAGADSIRLSSASTATNYGTLTGTFGYGIHFLGGGTVTNNAAGTITGFISGVYVSGSSGTLTNSGSITGSNSFGVRLSAGGTVTNHTGGTITGYSDGVNIGGSGGTVANDGTITGGTNGIAVYGGTGTVTNSGTVTGNNGYGIFLAAGGSVTNSAGGSVNGSGFGVYVHGGTGTIVNSGTITGGTYSLPTFYGVFLAAGGSVTNHAGGTITGYGTGIEIDNVGATITNDGRIEGKYGGGISFCNCVVGDSTVTNTGTIIGYSYGIVVSGGTATITNSGTITGSSRYGVALANGGTVTNQAGGTITGYTAGVYFAGSAGTLNNYGRITDSASLSGYGVVLSAGGSVTNHTGGTITGYYIGVEVDNVGATITNDGRIEGKYGAGISFCNCVVGTGTVTNTGTIVGYTYGIGSSGGTATITITNSGTITGTHSYGVVLSNVGTVTNQAGGTISGYLAGIYISGGTGTVTNAGRITSSTSYGVYLSAGGSVTNSGTITPGGGKAAIKFGGGAGVSNTLTLQTGSALGGNVTGGGSGATNTLILDGTGSESHDFTGFQSLQMNGSGDWTLGGTVQASSTTVTSGQLILNGTLNDSSGGSTATGTVSGGSFQVGDASHTSAAFNGDVTATGGTVSGHGTISGTLTNTSGTVVPGGSIGTLFVGNNFVQGPSGTLKVSFSSVGGSQLNVSNAATLDGTLNLDIGAGTKAQGYQILTALSGVSGTFATVTGAAQSGYTSTVTYLPNEVDVALAAAAGTNSASGSLTTNLPTATLDGAYVANNTLFQHLEQVGLGTDETLTAAAASAPIQVAFTGSTAELGTLVASLPEQLARYGGWFRATGQFGSVAASSTETGFDAQAGGFLGGLDRSVTDHLRLGLAGGYGRTNLHHHDDVQSSGTVDTPRIFGYGRYSLGTLFIDGALGYAFDRFDLDRPIAGTPLTATSSHDGHELSVAARIGSSQDLGWAIVTPKIGFQYAHLFEDGYTESGGGGSNLTVDGVDTPSLRPTIGVSMARGFATDSGTRLTPELRLNYSHELLSTSRSVTAQDVAGSGPTTVGGVSPSRDMVTVGTGLTVAMTAKLNLFVDYDATLRTSNYTSQTVSAGLRFKF
jgi:fibronectin-binding autotransporter adhesin